MLADGETDADPEAARFCPTPLSMLTDVAFVVVQLSIVACPAVIVVGLAVSFAVGAPGGGGPGAVTVTGAVAVTVPPDPVAVRV